MEAIIAVGMRYKKRGSGVNHRSKTKKAPYIKVIKPDGRFEFRFISPLLVPFYKLRLRKFHWMARCPECKGVMQAWTRREKPPKMSCIYGCEPPEETEDDDA